LEGDQHHDNFAPLKRFLVFILLLIVTITTLTPCCKVDDCAADNIAFSKQESGKHQTEGTCSPFFSCTSCPGFIAIEKPVQIPMPPVTVQQYGETVYTFHFPAYYASFWQPPRVG
jgi:hypothetical protein